LSDTNLDQKEITPASVIIALTNGEILQFDFYKRIVGEGFLCHCLGDIKPPISGSGFTWQIALTTAVEAFTQTIQNKQVQ